MPEILLDVLKYVFLSLIFLFLLRAMRAMRAEIASPRGSDARAPAQTSPKRPDKVVVTAPGEEPRDFSLEGELIIGRADSCNVVLTDTFASQIHARVFLRDSHVLIEDMGSTNGTRLNGRRVTSPIAVGRGDRVKIGKTELTFRR